MNVFLRWAYWPRCTAPCVSTWKFILCGMVTCPQHAVGAAGAGAEGVVAGSVRNVEPDQEQARKAGSVQAGLPARKGSVHRNSPDAWETMRNPGTWQGRPRNSARKMTIALSEVIRPELH